jgi:hypothetical protein
MDMGMLGFGGTCWYGSGLLRWRLRRYGDLEVTIGGHGATEGNGDDTNCL